MLARLAIERWSLGGARLDAATKLEQ